MSFVLSREEIAVIFLIFALQKTLLEKLIQAVVSHTSAAPVPHPGLVPSNKSNCLKLRVWFPC